MVLHLKNSASFIKNFFYKPVQRTIWIYFISTLNVDDGYTGRNFNRPAFQRMIADIEAGKIGCVITKDLSRLGRNYIEAGSYIEIFFPKHNVRYIAITDGVDSLTRQEMDITPFKNILNDMYSRDISKKVLAGRMTRSRQGKFCGKYGRRETPWPTPS